MTTRNWVARKLEAKGYTLTCVGDSFFHLGKDGMGFGMVYCPESSSEPFSIEEYDFAINSYENLEFIVIIKRSVTHQVYEAAFEDSVCVSGFTDLVQAISAGGNLGKFVGREHRYIQNRLRANREIGELLRLGESCYQVILNDDNRKITFVFIDNYEITADEVYNLIDIYSGIEFDCLVVTNPYVHGFSREAMQAAKEAGIELKTFNVAMAEL